MNASLLIRFGVANVLTILCSLVTCLMHKRNSGGNGISSLFWGGGTWAATVAVKVALAASYFRCLGRVFQGNVPLAVSGLASGFLTGITECLGTFLVGKTGRWRGASWNDLVGFGLGFGCFEAMALAVPSLLAVISGLSSKAAHRELEAAFSDPWRPWTFFLERAAAVPIHLLASVLLLRSAQTGNWKWFAGGFLVKGGVDAIPANALSPLALEGAYAVYGLASLGAHSLLKNRLMGTDS